MFLFLFNEYIYKNNFKPPQNFVNIYKSPRGTWPGPPKKEEGGN